MVSAEFLSPYTWRCMVPTRCHCGGPPQECNLLLIPRLSRPQRPNAFPQQSSFLLVAFIKFQALTRYVNTCWLLMCSLLPSESFLTSSWQSSWLWHPLLRNTCLLSRPVNNSSGGGEWMWWMVNIQYYYYGSNRKWIFLFLYNTDFWLFLAILGHVLKLVEVISHP
jgi:hypothetical protein